MYDHADISRSQFPVSCSVLYLLFFFLWIAFEKNSTNADSNISSSLFNAKWKSMRMLHLHDSVAVDNLLSNCLQLFSVRVIQSKSRPLDNGVRKKCFIVIERPKNNSNIFNKFFLPRKTTSKPVF